MSVIPLLLVLVTLRVCHFAYSGGGIVTMVPAVRDAPHRWASWLAVKAKPVNVSTDADNAFPVKDGEPVDQSATITAVMPDAKQRRRVLREAGWELPTLWGQDATHPVEVNGIASIM